MPPPAGLVLRGQVTRVESYGVFLSVPHYPRSCLVHVSQLADAFGERTGRVDLPAEPWREGEEFYYVVMDSEQGKVSGSMIGVVQATGEMKDGAFGGGGGTDMFNRGMYGDGEGRPGQRGGRGANAHATGKSYLKERAERRRNMVLEESVWERSPSPEREEAPKKKGKEKEKTKKREQKSDSDSSSSSDSDSDSDSSESSSSSDSTSSSEIRRRRRRKKRKKVRETCKARFAATLLLSHCLHPVGLPLLS